jgi:hypothetical protein
MEAIRACEALVGLVHPHTLGAMEALVFVLRQARTLGPPRYCDAASRGRCVRACIPIVPSPVTLSPQSQMALQRAPQSLPRCSKQHAAPLTLPPRPLCVRRPHARRHTQTATRLPARRLGTSTAHARRKSASCMGTRAAAVGSTRRRSRPERRWQGAAALWHSLPRCLSRVHASR